jgi:DNA polymerase zeta
MPRRICADGADPSLTSPEKAKGLITPGRLRIEGHFRNSQCILCRSFSDEGEHHHFTTHHVRYIFFSLGLCERCCATPAETISGLLSQARIAERRLQAAHDVCTTCTHSEPSEPVRCVSLDCPWLFQRKKVEKQAEDIEVLQELIATLELGDNIIKEKLDDLEEDPSEDDREKINAMSWNEIGEGEEH